MSFREFSRGRPLAGLPWRAGKGDMGSARTGAGEDGKMQTRRGVRVIHRILARSTMPTRFLSMLRHSHTPRNSVLPDPGAPARGLVGLARQWGRRDEGASGAIP
jgi:hypothetical protein